MSTSASRQYNFVDDRNNSIPITASRMDAEFDNVITKLNQKVIIAASAPGSPIAGQLWYDSTNKLLKQYRNAEWVIMGPVHIASSAPSTPQAGDLWVDTGSSYTVKVFNSSTWISLAKTTDVIETTGVIKMWSTNSAPTGYLICDGTAVSRATYSGLFAVIATDFGVGNGTTTFNLPNYKGRVPLGRDSADANFDILGNSPTTYVGEKTHTLTTPEMPAHTHNTQVGVAGGATATVASKVDTNSLEFIATTSTGGGGVHNNIQPYSVINFIIKT